MDCEFIEMQKGGRALVAAGYRYLTIRKGNEGRTFWRCCLRSCKAKHITVDDTVEVVRGEHNHAPCPSKNKEIAAMRKRAREEVQTVLLELIDIFKREQAGNDVTIIQLATGANPPPRKIKYRAIDSRIRNLKDNGGQVTIPYSHWTN